MEFRLLGLLEVEDGHGAVRIVRGRESALLALLLVHANEVLSTDRIVEELWGETRPAAGAKSVQVYVSRPRKAVGAERIETTPGFTRTIGADHIQVAADAAFAKRLGLRRVAILYDTAGLLDPNEERWFTYAARRVGLTTVPAPVDPGRKTLVESLARARADGAFIAGYSLGLDPAQGQSVLAALDRFFARKPVIVTDAFPAAAANGHRARFYATSAVPQPRAAIVTLLDAIASSDGSRRSVLEQLRGRRGVDRWGDPLTAQVEVRRLGDGRVVATVTPPVSAVPGGVISKVAGRPSTSESLQTGLSPASGKPSRRPLRKRWACEDGAMRGKLTG